MSKYFKIVGYIGIVSFIALSIWRLVMMIIDISAAARAPFDGMALAITLDVIFFLLSIFFGPALSLLFISYGRHLELGVYYPDELYNSTNSTSQSTNYEYYGKDNSFESDGNQEDEPEQNEIEVDKDPDKLVVSDLKINTDTIVINGTTYNADFLGIYALSITEDRILFTLAGTKYAVSYENDEEAKKLCDFLKKYAKD